MPKVGMEPIRRAALIDATITEIGHAGSLDITVGQIAKRAGVSSGLAHHYFGGKDDLLLAAMRHVLHVYGHEVLTRLRGQTTPLDRVRAIVEGAFAPSNFAHRTIAAWMNFYVLALSSSDARRLHRIYSKRLRSNLIDALRPALGADASDTAERIAALIDGFYLAQGLSDAAPDGSVAAARIMTTVEDVLR